MRNLILLTETRHRTTVPNLVTAQGPNISHLLRNPTVYQDDANNADDLVSPTTIYYFALLSSDTVVGLSLKGTIVWSLDLRLLSFQEQSGASLPALSDETKTKSTWFSLTYIEATESLVALSYCGLMVAINPFSGSGEVVGSFDFGIMCGSWSCDTELLCLLVNQSIGPESLDDALAPRVRQSIVMMNSRYEILTEEEFPDCIIDQSTCICWKPSDNSLVAVSSSDLSDKNQRIRIFDVNTLKMVSIARSEDGGGKHLTNLSNTSNIAWANYGCSHLLAGVQFKGKFGRHVVFMEANGLQHGSFKLNIEEGDEVTSLNWNVESDVLLVKLARRFESPDGKCSTKEKIQLYHRSNYHWYLKREIVFNIDISIGYAKFDALKNYDLLVTLSSGKDGNEVEWRVYQFFWNSSTISSDGCAAVVDGKVLNFTHLHRAIVPPPFYDTYVKIDEAVAEISFVPEHFLENFSLPVSVKVVALTCNGNLAFLGTSCFHSHDGVLSLVASLKGLDSFLLDPSCFRQLLVTSVSYGENAVVIKLLAVYCLTVEDGGSPSACDDLIELWVKFTSTEIIYIPGTLLVSEVINWNRHKVQDSILRMVHWTTYKRPYVQIVEANTPNSILIELTNGSLLEFSSSADSDVGSITVCEDELRFLEPCPYFAGLSSSDGRRFVIGLSTRSRLYIGERLIDAAVSSFILSPDHGSLVFVSKGSKSQLHILFIELLLKIDALSDLEDLNSIRYDPRDVERGSRMVAVLPQQPHAILEMPRGNLEVICPRGLVIPFVVRLILVKKYSDAFFIMRKQKIDVNLLCDVDPINFLKKGGVDRFLEQSKCMDHLNLFIAGLSNFDVTQSKYPIPDWLRNSSSEHDAPLAYQADVKEYFDFSSKVNQICSKLRLVMTTAQQNGTLLSRKVTATEFLLPILCTFAKESPPQLDQALLLIKTTAESCDKNSSFCGRKHPLFSERGQSSIQHLAFLSSYEILFDTALGLYDFEMAKAVARNSQMDPKQYLPLLNHYAELPTFMARYEVDLRLQRYSLALRNLFLIRGDQNLTEEESEHHFTTCLRFMEERQLHRLGLELFCEDKVKLGKIMLSLGRRLLQDGNAETALAIFSIAQPIDVDSIKKAARAIGDWRTFFAYHSFRSEESVDSTLNLRELASEIADHIASKKSLSNRRDAYGEAVRIILDYSKDVSYAIDLLVSAELWFEARRLCLYYEDEVGRIKVKEGAVAYAESVMVDLETKAEAFQEAMERYILVLSMVKDAKRRALGITYENDGADDTKSVFSIASNMSNTSIISTTSNSSFSSISSVISVGKTSSFYMVGSNPTKHPPKHQKAGQKKKKTRAKTEKSKFKRGSEDELSSLVVTMRANFIDDEQMSTIVETIRFLLQEDRSSLAKDVYGSYVQCKTRIDSLHVRRTEHVLRDEVNAKDRYRTEGRFFEDVILEYEKDIEAFRCAELPSFLHDTFSYLQLIL